MARYRTKQDEALDWICFQHYRDSGLVPQVLEANPGLAKHGPLLPAGLIVELPKFPATVQTPTVQLWD